MNNSPNRAPRSAQAGFSLPELMVVLAIVLLLAVLAMPGYEHAMEHAEEAAAQANLKRIHTAQEAHRVTTGSYAPSFEVLRDTNASPVPDDAETGDGGDDESVMVHHGYVYRLKRPESDRYTVTAEPIRNRSDRPHFEMDELGTISLKFGGDTQDGGEEDGGGGAGTTPPDEDQNQQDEQPPGAGSP